MAIAIRRAAPSTPKEVHKEHLGHAAPTQEMVLCVLRKSEITLGVAEERHKSKMINLLERNTWGSEDEDNYHRDDNEEVSYYGYDIDERGLQKEHLSFYSYGKSHQNELRNTASVICDIHSSSAVAF